MGMPDISHMEGVDFDTVNGKEVKVPIEIGLLGSNGSVEILTGLEEGDLIVY